MSSIPAVEDFEVAASFDDRTNTIRINVSDANVSVKPAGQPARSSSSTLCTPCRRYAAAMFISAIIAAGVWAYAKRGSSGTASDADFDIFDPSTWIPDWLDFNPHGGDSPYDFNKWNTNIAGKSACNGLELDVVDKLDDKWAPYFDQAIADWDRGDPDVLTLNVRKDSFYEEFGGCEALQGVLVVCNGDYGNTGKGVIKNHCSACGLLCHECTLPTLCPSHCFLQTGWASIMPSYKWIISYQVLLK